MLVTLSVKEWHTLDYFTGVPCCPAADPYGISQSCQKKQTRGKVLCFSVCEVVSAAFCHFVSIQVMWKSGIISANKGRHIWGSPHAEDKHFSLQSNVFTTWQLLLFCLFVSCWCKFNVEFLSSSSLPPTCFTKLFKQAFFFVMEKLKDWEGVKLWSVLIWFCVSNAMTNAVSKKNE